MIGLRNLFRYLTLCLILYFDLVFHDLVIVNILTKFGHFNKDDSIELIIFCNVFTVSICDDVNMYILGFADRFSK